MGYNGALSERRRYEESVISWYALGSGSSNCLSTADRCEYGFGGGIRASRGVFASLTLRAARNYVRYFATLRPYSNKGNRQSRTALPWWGSAFVFPVQTIQIVATIAQVGYRAFPVQQFQFFQVHVREHQHFGIGTDSLMMASWGK